MAILAGLEDIAESENLGAFTIMLKNNISWQKWRVAEVNSVAEKAAEVQVLATRKELREFMKRSGQPLVDLFPSVQAVANEISTKLFHTLDRSLESLKIIELARNTSSSTFTQNKKLNEQQNDQKEVERIRILTGRPRSRSL